MSQRDEEEEEEDRRARERGGVQLELVGLLGPLKMVMEEARLRNNFTAFQMSWVVYSQVFERLPPEANKVLFFSAEKYMGEVRVHLEDNGVAPPATMKLLLQMLPSLGFALMKAPQPGFVEFLRHFYLTFVKESVPCNVTDQCFLVLEMLL